MSFFFQAPNQPNTSDNCRPLGSIYALQSATFFLLVSALMPAAEPARVNLTGQVQTEAGQVVKGAQVSARMIQFGAKTLVSALTITHDDGSFKLTGLLPGEYRVCVRALEPELLNPCQWTERTTHFRVTDKSSRVPLNIAVKRGTALKLESPAAKAKRNSMPGIWTKEGMFVPIPITQDSRDVRSVYVPAEAALPLTDSQSVAANRPAVRAGNRDPKAPGEPPAVAGPLVNSPALTETKHRNSREKQ